MKLIELHTTENVPVLFNANNISEIHPYMNDANKGCDIFCMTDTQTHVIESYEEIKKLLSNLY